jgi:hypothetical protein
MLVFSPDPQYDLSLRVLSLLVAAALIASLIAFLTTIIRPQPIPDQGEVGPPSWAAESLPLLAEWEPPPQTRASARKIYRCDTPSEVIYSDRPCPRGHGRVLVLPSQ